MSDPWLLGGMGAGGAALAWALLHGWQRRRDRPAAAPERITPSVTSPVAADLDAALYTAARSGHSARALELLDAGADAHALPPPDARDQRSLIALAAVLPDLALLRALIARGLDLNHAHAGMSALIAATRDSWHGRPDAVLTLISNGADPRQPDLDGNTPLHHAARSTDPGVAALLCDAGAEIEARNHEGVTPLGMACACGNWRLAKFLIEHGARAEGTDSTPALLSAAAADADDPAGVELLLKHKARVNSRDAQGRSALNEAARHGHVGIIHALIAAGAEIDSADAEGCTALLDAVHGGHLDAVETLIAAAASLHRSDAQGRNALALACLAETPSLPLVQRLLELGVTPDLPDHSGKSAIEHAVSAGRWALVKCLDPAYPLPPSVSDHAPDAPAQQPPLELLRTLLQDAAPAADEHAALAALLDLSQLGSLLHDPQISTHPDHVRWLLAQGVDPDLSDGDGHSPLQRLLPRLPGSLPAVLALLQHAGTSVSGRGVLAQVLELALRNPSAHAELEQCALLLIARGADLRPAVPDHPPPITLAVRLGWDQVLEQLARKGVDLNTHGPDGLAALHLAAALGRERSVCLLLRYGAALDLRTQDGQSALGIALAAGHRDLANWLDWRGWRLPDRALRADDLPAAAAAGDAQAVQRLLTLGLALDATDAQGCTALVRAAGGGHLDLTRQLLERGADLNHSTHSGATALSAAVNMDHRDIIACLLKAGADLDQRLPGELSVLMLAAARGLPEACAQLLAAGSDIHASTSHGLSALHCAARFGFVAQDGTRLHTLLAQLIAAGADCNAATSDGLTPLLMLLGAHAEPGSAGDDGVIDAALQQLLQAGSRVDAQERQHGFGPLHLAAQHGLARAAQRLLRAGADPELRDHQARPPRAIAIARGFIDIATELTHGHAHGSLSMAQFLNRPG